MASLKPTVRELWRMTRDVVIVLININIENKVELMFEPCRSPVRLLSSCSWADDLLR